MDIAIILDGKMSPEQIVELRADFTESLSPEGFIVEARGSGVVAFKRKGIAGEVVEELHIHGAFVHIVCNEYRGWTFTRDTAIKRLTPLFSRLKDGRAKFSSAGMSFQDVFLSDDPGNYFLSDVFRVGNRFLAPAISEGHNRWKQDVSWVGKKTESAFVTADTFLKIEAKIASSDPEDKQSHVTEITHRQLASWKSGKVTALTDESYFREVLNELHCRNKSLLLELLNDEMISKIGLKE
ncbi:MAG: hypothetical protein V4673_15385 [Pseudomonadota bacterium]